MNFWKFVSCIIHKKPQHFGKLCNVRWLGYWKIIPERRNHGGKTVFLQPSITGREILKEKWFPKQLFKCLVPITLTGFLYCRIKYSWLLQSCFRKKSEKFFMLSCWHWSHQLNLVWPLLNHRCEMTARKEKEKQPLDDRQTEKSVMSKKEAGKSCHFREIGPVLMLRKCLKFSQSKEIWHPWFDPWPLTGRFSQQATSHPYAFRERFSILFAIPTDTLYLIKRHLGLRRNSHDTKQSCLHKWLDGADRIWTRNSEVSTKMFNKKLTWIKVEAKFKDLKRTI